ncbi:MAG TPA: DUF2752 domain-containing protein [Bryobacteraceae bacterium]|nr:DUF2752 domain-containing protein [Bryobacteraceae bacterium]
MIDALRIDAEEQRAWAGPWFRIGGSLALLAVLWAVTVPAEPRFRLCAFHWLTGRQCPLCGMTRALFALGKGRFSEAVHFNALSPLGSVMLFSLFWSGAWRARLWSAGIAAFAVYGVWRVMGA